MYFRRNSSFLFIVRFVSCTLAFYFVNASAPALKGFCCSMSKSTLSFLLSVSLLMRLLCKQLLVLVGDDSGFGVKVVALNFVNQSNPFACFALPFRCIGLLL